MEDGAEWEDVDVVVDWEDIRVESSGPAAAAAAERWVVVIHEDGALTWPNRGQIMMIVVVVREICACWNDYYYHFQHCYFSFRGMVRMMMVPLHLLLGWECCCREEELVLH